MSHFATVEIELRDAKAIVQALTRLGFRAEDIEIHQTEKQIIRGYNQTRQGNIIIRRQVFKGLSDLGFEREDNGRYRLWIDDMDLGNLGGQIWVKKLIQAYGVEKAKIEAKKRGYLVSEKTLADGTVRLSLRK